MCRSGVIRDAVDAQSLEDPLGPLTEISACQVFVFIKMLESFGLFRPTFWTNDL